MMFARSVRRLGYAMALGPLCALLAACASVPGRHRTLDSLTLAGNHALDDDEIEEKIASHESPRFLGLFPGVIDDYALFDRHVLERDLQRIERYYRARGYYHARVRAGRVRRTGERGTKVEILIEEGEPTLVARLDVHGLEGVPRDVAERARRAAERALPLHAPFEEQKFAASAEALRLALADAGYARTEVQRVAEVDLPRNLVSVGLFAHPDRRMRFGQVRIEGLGPVPEAPVRRALALEPGKPFSQSELDSAEQALLDLGAFSSVTVEPDLEHAHDQEVPIRVKVVPSDFRSVRVGAGGEIDTIHTELHGLAAYEDHNFLGGLRRFLVEVRPGVVLFPTRIPSFERPEALLPQGKLRGEFRQPGFIESRTNALLRAEANVYPVLLAQTPRTAPILGYRDYRAAAGLERSYWRLYGNVSHNLQVVDPFTYRGARDPALGAVVASYPELELSLDLRNDAIEPHYGAYLRADAQVAGVGGDARDVKLEPEARGYVPLARRVTLALRARVGLLFPSNYGSSLVPNAFTKTSGGLSRADWVRDVQLLFLRGFFSGGSGSNRGYGVREIGPHGTVPFYNPGQTNEALTAACAGGDTTSCNLPLGGLSLWEAGVELRFPLLGPLSGALFTDASDVSPYRARLQLDRPHLSVGLGLRYTAPVGPVRLDVGYRVPGLQAPVSPDEGTPDELFGLPMAISLGIGEPF